MFLKYMNYQIWTMVEKRFTPPTITIEGVEICKLADKRDENKIKMDSLVCVLSSDEFYFVQL